MNKIMRLRAWNYFLIFLFAAGFMMYDIKPVFAAGFMMYDIRPTRAALALPGFFENFGFPIFASLYI
ncbi:MAG: hypothetical protein MIO92_11920, partial [Methanosarcinaceae archaeon]|nr:hypothetical protein [Methanosarcinaceae archaeon]